MILINSIYQVCSFAVYFTNGSLFYQSDFIKKSDLFKFVVRLT